tara:strand:- start:306 stop:611 length:306 start_codon:yes stop_codon:yes gene_type:complete
MAKKEKIDSPGNKKSVFQLIKTAGGKLKEGYIELDDQIVKRIFTEDDLKKYRDAVKRGDEVPLRSTQDLGASIREFMGTETEYDKNKKKKNKKKKNKKKKK